MSKLTLKLDAITDDVVEKAKASGGGQRYDGPVPPPDVYKVKLRTLQVGKTKTGKDRLFAAFNIVDSEGGVYDGAPVTESYMIPVSSDDPNYLIFVSKLHGLMSGISGGKLGVREFTEAASSGKIQVEDAKKEGGMQKITQIGAFKLDKASDLEVKTELDEYKGEQRASLHYIIENKSAAKADESDDDDLDLDLDLDPDDDLDLGDE